MFYASVPGTVALIVTFTLWSCFTHCYYPFFHTGSVSVLYEATAFCESNKFVKQDKQV